MEGIFRLGGNVRRINELEHAFDSPDRYGRGLDWTGYTVHDAANILRRYFNRLPQPIVPFDFYERFREPLRGHQEEAVDSKQAHIPELGGFDLDFAITTYQRLITELPPLNRQLLLYTLDLLAVFASKADKNRMDANNLASIFQPGMLNHPDHVMRPSEYALNQDVVVFLIQQQDHFLVGMPGTAADEQTVKDIQNAPRMRGQNSPRSPRIGLGRSASNASAGADSARRLGGLRRNVSVSSKHSRHSSNLPSPGTPGTPQAISGGSGVQRSNTVPSKKSPNVPSGRFHRPFDPSPSISQPASAGFLSPEGYPGSSSPQQAQAPIPTEVTPSSQTPAEAEGSRQQKDQTGVEQIVDRGKPAQIDIPKQIPASPSFAPVSTPTPAKERRISSIFSKSPASESERKDGRQPNKLRKKRMPESSNASARSSTYSLLSAPDSPGGKQEFYSPMPTPVPVESVLEDPLLIDVEPPNLSKTAATSKSGSPTPVAEKPQPEITTNTVEPQQPALQSAQESAQESTLNPLRSPPTSVRSRSSAADLSEADALDTAAEKPQKKRHPWRSSTTASKSSEAGKTTPKAPSSSHLGASSTQEQSTTSVVSGSHATKSTPNTSQQILAEGPPAAAAGHNVPVQAASSNESTPARDVEDSGGVGSTTAPAEVGSPERKGPIKWLKAKVAQAKEEREERKAEKERAKSPSPPGPAGPAPEESKQSLSAIANEGTTLPSRGRSEVGAEPTTLAAKDSVEVHDATPNASEVKGEAAAAP